MRCNFCQRENHPNLFILLATLDGLTLANDQHSMTLVPPRGSQSVTLEIPEGLVRDYLGKSLRLTVSSTGRKPGE